ncbi:hypothetical protein [uncultured Duncaniella sp.]|uniref:hypothetical protein n=1 Tax=uncultured Duncaniella sp. TaxID=2768039 RepID=UPI0025A97AF3|nr:hypothetical protein [uncultured Duncaniella sp.]
MSHYSYLHIALRGEIQGATRTIYSYPASGSDIDPCWNSTMVEPGAAIKRFLNASECYILQSSPLGHYFSLITRNTVSPERGYMMISILVENGCALTGRQLMNAFSQLKKVLIEDENLSDEAVDDALSQAGIPSEPLRLEAWKYHTPDESAPLAEAAYRTYISQQELESIFSFPCQPDYSAYRCIIVVAATTSLRPGVKMPRITVAIRKLYSVVCPEGVSASSTQVYDGDRLELSFAKEGFATCKENVIVGTPSAYTKYDGSTIIIRTPAQTGIRFERRIPVRVMSAKGKQLNGYTITLNGRSVNTMEPYIELYEKDLQPGSEVEIVVQSNNYRPLKLKTPAEEMLVTEQLELVMQPVEQGVTLRLDFGDGRVFEQQISIEKNTPEYNRLHSGNFHGFRAHRQVTQDDSEVYNVDVRITSRPVAPNFESSDSDTGEKETKAPIFENISADAKAERPKIDATLPTAIDPEEDDKSASRPSDTTDNDYRSPEPESDEDDDNDPTEKPTGKSRRNLFIWGGLAAIAAVIALVIFLPQFTGPSDTEAENIAGEEQSDDPNRLIPATMTQEEGEDVAYLNTYPVWEVDKMKSEMGKSLMAAIQAGDIDAVVNNDYYTVTGRATNEKAILVANLIWRAKGSYSDGSNRRIMRSAVKNGQIDLRTLSDNLAKRRPAEKENTSPRPSR